MSALLWLLLACTEKDTDTGVVLDPPEELEIPGIQGVDLDQLFVDTVKLGITADARVAWDAHAISLDLMDPGCPDIYAGIPDLEIDDLDEDVPGYSWLDQCYAGDERFGGYEYWENDVRVTGELEDPSGQTVAGQRSLIGNGVISVDDDVTFEFDGEASDSLTKIDDSTGFSRFVYSSLVDGTITGSIPFPDGSPTPGGWRTDMYLSYTGGDVDSLEARGNVYFFEKRINDRFDSLAMDIEFTGPNGATPDDCAIEPRGWIGVRDENAYWYDVVFEPRFDDDATDSDYPNDPYTACDGCGTLYIRGIAQDVQVCPDLSFLWDGALTPPQGNEYALSLRDFLEDP